MYKTSAIIVSIVLLSGLIGWLYYEEEVVPERVGCVWYEDKTLARLPLKCYDYYKINKGCFDVKAKRVMVGRVVQTTYEVTPLCE